MKKAVIILISILVLSPCSKDGDLITLTGTFTEVSPLPGRTKLEFFGGNKLLKTRAGEPSEDFFYYRIMGNKIELTSIGENSTTTTLDFERVSNSKFIIENLYPAIPELPKVYLTFVK